MAKKNTPIEIFNNALENYQNKNFTKAESICKKIFKANSKHYQSIFLLGVISAQNNKLQQAAKFLNKAVQINTNFVDAHYNLGIVYDKLEKYKDSIKSYKKTIKINPKYIEALLNLGNVFQKLEQYQQAISCFQKAIAINPNNNPYAYYNLGHVFNVLDKTQSAITYYQKAIAINPNYKEAQLNLGNIFHKLGQYQQAISCFQKAIAINPNYTEAQFNLARIQLAKDDFKNGWIGHEQRTGGIKSVYKSLGIKPENIWSGTKFRDSLVVHGEQGIGDEILYSSIFKDLKNYHRNLIITADNRLIPLFKRSWPQVKFIDRYNRNYINKNILIRYKHIFAGSLGKIFRNSLDDFNNNKSPWLFSCPKKYKEIENNLSYLKKIKIGISWKTSGIKSQARNISLVKLASFFPKKNFEIINLQYGNINFDKDTFEKKEKRKLICFDEIDYKNDLDSIAALICNCDLVVTVGNAIAHLAGALGKDVWTLVPIGSQWWWHHNRNKSLWYPKLKILRQKNRENWNDVFGFLKKEVQSYF